MAKNFKNYILSPIDLDACIRQAYVSKGGETNMVEFTRRYRINEEN